MPSAANNNLRVAKDTNVYFSALTHPLGIPAKLWRKAIERRYVLLTSPPIMRKLQGATHQIPARRIGETQLTQVSRSHRVCAIIEAMQQLDLLVPEHTLDALQLTPEGMSAELRLAAAMKLHEIGRLSAGAAAELAGLSHPEFLQRLDEYNVHTFDLTEDELLRDAGNARGPQ